MQLLRKAMCQGCADFAHLPGQYHSEIGPNLRYNRKCTGLRMDPYGPMGMA